MTARLADIITGADGGGDPGDVAKQVIKAVLADLSPEDQESVLLPVIRAAVVSMRRRAARKIEDRAFGVTAPDELTSLRILRDEPFLDVLSHAMTTWAKATAKQHRARAKYLRDSQVRPTLETASRHETAAKIIESAGVERLAQVPGYAHPEAA